jgi:peptidoglycan/LPS O-acetylase OafA/YrhL
MMRPLLALISVAWLHVAEGNIGLSDCSRVIHAFDDKDSTILSTMKSASGKNLPYDAGKFALCEDLKQKAATKFFLVTLKVKSKTLGQDFVSGEVGLCLPAQCHRRDLINDPSIVNLMTGNQEATFMVPRYKLSQPPVIAPFQSQGQWKQPPNSIGHVNPASVEDDLKPWSSGATVTSCVILGLMMWSMLSTAIFKMAARSSHTEQLPGSVDATNSSIWERLSKLLIVEAWSLTGPNGTWTTLWKCPAKRPTDCLNGIRVLSMFSIVLAHSYGVTRNNAGYGNAEVLDKDGFDKNFLVPFLDGAGDMSVDSFFYISGFLLSLIAKSRHSPVIKGTVLRYLRLTPSVAFMVLIYGWITPYVMYGPFAPRAQESILRKCTQNWWANILFIQNWTPGTLYGPFDPSEMCAGWTWYLGNDFIFAIVGLILVNIWRARHKVGWMCVVALLGVSFAFSMTITWQHQMGTSPEGTGARVYTYFLYSNPLHRIPVFLVGLVLPWIYDSLERRGLGRDENAPKTLKARLLWICVSAISGGMMLFIIHGHCNGGTASGKPSNARQFMSSLTMTLARPIWAIALAVITSACYYGYLPLVDGFFSHWAWHPLVKLTYGTYLLHIVVIKTFAGNMTGFFHYSLSEVLLHAFGFFALTYAASVAMWCLIEKPFAAFTDALVPKKKQGQQAQGKEQILPSSKLEQKPQEAFLKSEQTDSNV